MYHKIKPQQDKETKIHKPQKQQQKIKVNNINKNPENSSIGGEEQWWGGT